MRRVRTPWLVFSGLWLLASLVTPAAPLAFFFGVVSFYSGWEATRTH